MIETSTKMNGQLVKPGSTQVTRLIKDLTLDLYQAYRRKRRASMIDPKCRRSTSFNRNSTSRSKIDTNHGETPEKDSDSVKSRTSRTAPSTPEAEIKHILSGDSRSSLINNVDNMDSHKAKSKTPSPELNNRIRNTSGDSPIMNKHRAHDKFHKLFRNVPEDEEVIKQFSCAYFADILLQGSLYITQNWFCFHSKIVGKKKIIEIPIEKVVDITREKTAFIIPNAIGVVTDTDKYVFGSLISRDSTFRIMLNLWRKHNGCQDIESFSGTESLTFLPDTSTVTGDLDITTTDSELGTCSSCDILRETVPNDVAAPPFPTHLVSRKLPQKRKEPNNNHIDIKHRPTDQQISYLRILLPYVLFWFDLSGHYKSFCRFLLKLQRMQRITLFITLCIVLIFFFVLSASVLAYKVMVLQAQIDGRIPVQQQQQPLSADTVASHTSYLYRNLYHLNNERHIATVEKLHSVLSANIQVLEDVHRSLKTLENTHLSQQNQYKNNNKQPYDAGHCTTDSPHEDCIKFTSSNGVDPDVPP
ncbi:uncharacterized protein LOC141905819 isoform X2 [Tubulanus polymorphus]|uniref:uncharacterized protein LOC141905819 isoform X2 n=1 Tax=Tubulanus polymorphus TaxID=672921 RepID=UPI003DA1FA68